MKRYIIYILISILEISLAFSESYEIEDYLFKWNLFQTGTISLTIEKDQERSIIKITENKSYSYGTLIVPLINTIDLSVLLGKANDYYLRQKDTTIDVSEEEILGAYKARFSTSLKYGFSVNITDANSSYSSGFDFKLKEALDISKELEDVNNKAAYLNTKIVF